MGSLCAKPNPPINAQIFYFSLKLNTIQSKIQSLTFPYHLLLCYFYIFLNFQPTGRFKLLSFSPSPNHLFTRGYLRPGAKECVMLVGWLVRKSAVSLSLWHQLCMHQSRPHLNLFLISRILISTIMILPP